MPMWLRRAAATALIALTAGAGCSLLTDVEPLESGVQFTVMDGYDLNGTAQGVPAPYLSIATEKIYGCMNYPLQATVARSGSTTTVEIGGVRKVDMCLTATGPATFRTRLELASGTSTLVIRGAGAQDRYQVTASDRLEVAPAAGAISHTLVPRSWRVPHNTFAARCEWVPPTVALPAARCAAFQDSVAALAGVTRYLFGAEATPPTPPFRFADPSTEERAYAYLDETAVSLAQGLVQRLARRDSAFYLSLRTWRNEYYPVWRPD